MPFEIMQIMPALFVWSRENLKVSSKSWPAPRTSYIVYVIFWFIILALYSLKCWDLFYKQQHQIAVGNKVWTEKIDPDVSRHDFFLSHSNTWGNWEWVAQTLLPAPFVLSVAVITLCFVFLGERTCVKN